MKNLFWAVGSIIVSVILSLLLAVAVFGLHKTASMVGSITSPATNLDFLQLSQGLQLPAGPSVSTSNSGTALQGMFQGNCIILAAATTIAATSTAQVDCQAGASSPSALSGVQAGDNVFTHATSSWPTTSQGLQIVSSQASTTNGYITMKIFNGTGTTFTWTNTASTSIQYWAIR